MVRIWRLKAVMLGGKYADLNRTDRLLVRAIGVVAALLVLAALALGVAYYRERYYHPTVAAVDRDIAAVEEQIRRQPRDVALRLNAAYLYVDKGRHDDAIAQAQAVLQVAPEDFRALQVIGMAYLGKQDRAQAIAHFERAVAANRDNPMARASRQLAGLRFYLGRAYLEDRRLDEAIGELRGTVESDATNADALQLLGDALLAQGDAAGAIGAYQGAVRLVPDFGEAYRGLARAYALAGDEAGVGYSRAMVAYSEGDYQQAIGRLGEVAVPWAERAELHLGLAMAYDRAGQPEQALAVYQEALRLAPDSVAARRGLSRLTGDR